jgi:hypothetical protein
MLQARPSPPKLPSQSPAQNPANRTPQQATTQHQPQESFWERTTADPVAFWTLWLVLFTAVLAGASIIQMRFLIRADRTAAKAADAAAKAAEATEASVATMRETAERQLRAYVALDYMDLVSARDASYGGYEAQYVIRNSGETPAYDVRLAMQCRVREYPLTAELPIVTDDQLGPAAPLNPGGEINRIVRDTEAAAKNDIHYGVMRDYTDAVYYFGLVTYRDAFGKNHRTKFRMYWYARMDRPMPHQAGNEAD